MITKDTIIADIAKERGIPEEQVKLVIDSLFDGLRHYLTHPLEAKSGVTIHNWLSFYIGDHKINNYIERLKLKNFKRKPTSEENALEFYETLLENKKRYERQKSKPVLDR